MNDGAGEPRFTCPEDNIKMYLGIAKLPGMVLGENAPPMPPPHHKAHLNHLHVQPEPYRKILSILASCRDVPEYDQLVRTFSEQRLPSVSLDVPPRDERTGAAFTIPVRGLNLSTPEAFLPRPNTFDDMMPWIYSYPFQTLTRTMQVSFPRAASRWSITPLPHQDTDRLIWQTYVWRKSPPPSDLETYYRYPQNPIPKCSLIICMQPPWVLSEADIDCLKRHGNFPAFVEDGNNKPYTSGLRIWAKLWDLCVRVKCRFWVLTSYQRWIFGSFSKSFKAGHIYAIKSYDASNPTVIQTLVFHTAKSMGLANNLYLPEYFDSTEDNDDPPEDLPQPPTYPDMKFENSESEWEGMDDEPGLSAGVSDYLDAQLSAYGSAANVESPIIRMFRNNAPRRPPRPPPRRRRPTPPVAGPSRLAGPSPLRARRTSLTASPRIPVRASSGLADSDVELEEAQPVREFVGISRATAEVTEFVQDWQRRYEDEAGEVEEVLFPVIDDENPNAITHALAIEPIYQAAMETVNANGGNSHSLPRPSEVTNHHQHGPDVGGYMNVIPELGTIREVEETEALEEQLRRDAHMAARWEEYANLGIPVPEGGDISQLLRDQ